MEITYKQMQYVQLIAMGLTQRQAYIKAYPTCLCWKNKSTIDKRASELLKRPNVQKYFNKFVNEVEEQAKSDGYSLLTKEQKMSLLTKWIRGDEFNTADKLRALDILNKMDGTYTKKEEIKQIGGSWWLT